MLMSDHLPGDLLFPSQMRESKSIHLGDLLDLMHIHIIITYKKFCQ